MHTFLCRLYLSGIPRLLSVSRLKIQVVHVFRRLLVRGRTIYYCTRGKGLKMFNLSDIFFSDIISSAMHYVYYVTTSGDKLYYTNTITNTVTCCDLHGTTQWEFKDERVLQDPRGISVDNDGNMYVIGVH
jgi:hypothetical protein